MIRKPSGIWNVQYAQKKKTGQVEGKMLQLSAQGVREPGGVFLSS